MNTIPKASDARTEALKNPSFERKVGLYNSVVEKIKEASSKGERSFSVSEAEYYALHKEILEKGYTENPLDNLLGSSLMTAIRINVGGLISECKGKPEEDYNYYKTYYFN